MKEIKFSDDVIEKIKDYDEKYYYLTDEQKQTLIDKLILNEELKERYREYDLCDECRQPNNDVNWCRSCNAKRFRKNFKNWTSGNHDVDRLIKRTQLKAKNHREILEWIEYDRFLNIEYLAKGGFGTTYSASWIDGYILDWDTVQWGRMSNRKVALKCLHNSQNITTEFLKEIELHTKVYDTDSVVKCYGITKNPETAEFIMVMEYAENGSLRQHLDNRFNLLDWKDKLCNLYTIIIGLKKIHNSGLIHHDFHCGNVLSYSDDGSMITDLGLCRPVNLERSQSKNDKIYGVLPYVAPGVLKGNEYTQASDVYGFGIIAYELCTGLPPYHDIAHDEFLATKICRGLRPKSNYKIPWLISNIIEQCWDENPLLRPKVDELEEVFDKLHYEAKYKPNSRINIEIDEAKEINKNSASSALLPLLSTSNLSYATHSQAIYTSRHLDFKNLQKPKNDDNDVDSDNDSDSPFEIEYSESVRIDFCNFTKLDI